MNAPMTKARLRLLRNLNSNPLLGEDAAEYIELLERLLDRERKQHDELKARMSGIHDAVTNHVRKYAR